MTSPTVGYEQHHLSLSLSLSLSVSLCLSEHDRLLATFLAGLRFHPDARARFREITRVG